MGKKYIVEVGRLERLYKAYTNGNGKPNLTWLSPEVDLTPYTEPDLELIKKKARDNGYSEGYQDGYSKGMNDYLQSPEVKEESDRAYAHGYSDAESKFSEIRKEAYEEGFKDGQYAERAGLVANYAQVHKIKIGDEVTAEHGGSTFTVTWMSDVCICGIDSEGRCYSYDSDEVDGKTGNHYDIATVLEKMRGETND